MNERFRPCSVEGCEGNSHYTARGAKGWCGAHYQRWAKYGDPLAGGTAHGEPVEWLLAHVNHLGDECLRWPFSRYQNGSAQVRYRGASTRASRIMCTLAHGEPFEPGLEAAHSCGKDHLGCVNPRHLRWDTPKGNCADRVEHGTENRGERQWMAKLTRDDVRQIRSMEGMFTHMELAKMFKVARMTVTDILRRKTWSWLE